MTEAVSEWFHVVAHYRDDRRRRVAYALDLTEAVLLERVVAPWRKRDELVISGTIISPENLVSLGVVRTKSRERGDLDSDRAAAFLFAETTGEDVTDEFFITLEPRAPTTSSKPTDARSVFHRSRQRSRAPGRARGAPIEWETAVALTGIPSPSIPAVLEAGLSHAQAIVVLMTGDDLARGNQLHQPAARLPGMPHPTRRSTLNHPGLRRVVGLSASPRLPRGPDINRLEGS